MEYHERNKYIILKKYSWGHFGLCKRSIFELRFFAVRSEFRRGVYLHIVLDWGDLIGSGLTVGITGHGEPRPVSGVFLYFRFTAVGSFLQSTGARYSRAFSSFSWDPP